MSSHDEDELQASLPPRGARMGPLQRAAAGVDREAFERALSTAGSKLDSRDATGATPLTAAIDGGALEHVRLPLNAGADVNGRSKLGGTPLHHALAAPDEPGASPVLLAIIELLLERKADVHALTPDGTSPLHPALTASDPVVLQRLLDAGARPQGRPAELQRASDPPRFIAVGRGWTTQASMLLRAGSPVDVSSRRGETPLLCAVRNNALELVHLLVKHGANIHEPQGRAADLPLVSACSLGLVEMTKALLALGANPAARARANLSALAGALARPSPECAAALMEQGVVEPGALGVVGVPDDEAVAQLSACGLCSGAPVRGVLQGSAAHQAGLKSGDVVLAVEGQSVRTMQHSAGGMLESACALRAGARDGASTRNHRSGASSSGASSSLARQRPAP